jgi:hypothetical protein
MAEGYVWVATLHGWLPRRAIEYLARKRELQQCPTPPSRPLESRDESAGRAKVDLQRLALGDGLLLDLHGCRLARIIPDKQGAVVALAQERGGDTHSPGGRTVQDRKEPAVAVAACEDGDLADLGGGSTVVSYPEARDALDRSKRRPECLREILPNFPSSPLVTFYAS